MRTFKTECSARTSEQRRFPASQPVSVPLALRLIDKWIAKWDSSPSRIRLGKPMDRSALPINERCYSSSPDKVSPVAWEDLLSEGNLDHRGGPLDSSLPVGEALYLLRAVILYYQDQASEVIRRWTWGGLDKMWRRLLSIPRGKFVSYVKFMLLVPVARWFHRRDPVHNLVPANPGCEPLLVTGALRRDIRRRILSDSGKHVQFLYGFYQLKRACRVVSSDFILETYVKHREVITRPFRLSEDPEVKALDETDWRGRVRRKTTELLKGINWEPTVELHEVTSSASYGIPRKNGGTRNVLLAAYGSAAPGDGKLLQGILGPCDTDEAIMNYSFEAPTLDRVSAFCKRYPLNKVQVHGVLEPLKVRTITKGNPFKQHLAKGLQKSLHSHLRKFPVFRLIGRPLQATDLQDIGTEWDPKTFWVSGDYSGATDTVRIDATKAVFETVIDELLRFAAREEYKGKFQILLDLSFVNSLRDVIYEQMVEYPPKSGIPPGKQANGQLMGSVLSFPILCIINLLTYWFAYEDYLDEEVALHELFRLVLVNGDDICFRSDDELYTLWKRWVSVFGFELSLGKNYCDKKTCMINSELFRGTVNMTSLRFWNVGLVVGQSKVGNVSTVLHTETRDEPEIAQVYREALSGAKDKVFAHSAFCTYHRRAIQDLTCHGRYALFLPTLLGGCGFEGPDSVLNRCYFTRRQLLVAQGLYNRCNWHNPSYRRPGADSDRRLTGTKCRSWVVRKGSYVYAIASECDPRFERAGCWVKEEPREEPPPCCIPVLSGPQGPLTHLPRRVERDLLSLTSVLPSKELIEEWTHGRWATWYQPTEKERLLGFLDELVLDRARRAGGLHTFRDSLRTHIRGSTDLPEELVELVAEYEVPPLRPWAPDGCTPEFYQGEFRVRSNMSQVLVETVNRGVEDAEAYLKSGCLEEIIPRARVGPLRRPPGQETAQDGLERKEPEVSRDGQSLELAQAFPYLASIGSNNATISSKETSSKKEAAGERSTPRVPAFFAQLSAKRRG